ncbi:MAG: GerMN domain-containing protein [Patescibacteria group bacterium]|nr:GerMN domain-containing protein [Patescibacteria group bacterium]
MKIFYVILLLAVVSLIGCSCERAEWAPAPTAEEKGIDMPAGVTTETMTLKIFFNNSNLDPEFTCVKVFSVTREVEKTVAVGRAAIEELLKGPTEAELAEGYITNINPGVILQSLKIIDSVAYADFDETLERAVGGSCRVAAISAQIRETLMQFPTVKSVVISIDGRTEDILQP